MDNDGVLVEVHGQTLRCYRNGDVFRLSKTGEYRLVDNCKNNGGYNVICCNGKMVRRHRIIIFAFTEFDIYNTKLIVDHIDGNRLNNSISNLRVVTYQENQHNQLHCKGYYWEKTKNKWKAQIKDNQKVIHLGYYNTRWEARQSYLNAVPIYHPTAPIHLFTNDEDDCPDALRRIPQPQ